MVSDLIDPDIRQRNINLLYSLFQPRDIKEITNIPLSTTASEDTRIWHFSRNGNYSVKSGYKLIMSLTNQDNHLGPLPETWIRMWKIEVPPKIKIFLWRVARNCIPCRKNLQARRMSVPICCVLRGSVIENTWHIFIDCLYAHNCWTIANMVQIVAECATQSESFT